MSDPGSRRQPIDLEEFERRLRGASNEPRAPAKDPLAELARLVGGDPLERPATPASRPQMPPSAQQRPNPEGFTPSRGPMAPQAPSFNRAPQADGTVQRPAAGDLDFDFGSAPRVNSQAGWSAAPQPARAPLSAPPPRQAPAFPTFTPPQQAYAPAPSYAAKPQPPQDESFNQAYGSDPRLDDDAYAPEPADFGPKGRLPKSRRTLYVGGAAAAILVLGIGTAFTMRGGDGTRQTPTILANSNPSKVQPAAQADSGASNASMLDKDNSDKSGPTRVVARQEQPIDIQQGAKSPPSSSSSGTPFGEPKRVRTVAVRPDGTFISSDTAPVGAPPANSGPRIAGLPSPGITAASGVAIPTGAAAGGPPRAAGAPLNLTPASTPSQAAGQTPAPAASAPRPPVRTIPTTPQAAKPAVVADANTSADQDVTPTPKVPARATARPKDAVAAADTAAAPSSGSGGFAVQVAAAGSEAEAKDKMASLGAKFSSELSGYRLGYKQGDSNGKPVWRVRVNGLTREAATQLCTNLKAGGGACFVAAN